MKARNKSQLIEQLSTEVKRHSNIDTDQFQSLTSNQLLTTTDSGGWSIIQNLEHLNMYYKYYNPAIAESLKHAQKDPSISTFTSGWLGKYFTNAMDYRGKNKVKAFKDYIPIDDLDASSVMDTFLKNQNELLRLLDLANEYDLTKIKTAISLTKWIKMRLGDVFQFVIMHNERHIVQAQSRV